MQHVWRNHDHDLVNVQLTTTTSGGADSSVRQSGTTGASSRLHRWVTRGALAAGLAATLLTTAGGAGVAQAAPPATATPTFTHTASTETIHTTANHPWLTADCGWVHAGDLRPGERVVMLPAASNASGAATTSSGTATVAWAHAVAGAGEMDNLTVAQDHTYAVGASRAVVHNTDGPCGSDLYNQNQYSGELYRGDSRSPDEIFSNGFQPHGTDTDLAHHLLSELDDTAWVSTSKSKDIAAIYAANNEGYMYSVQTSGVDVPALMDQGYYAFNEMGHWEQEVAVLGGIPNTRVIGAWKAIEGDGVTSPVRFGPFIHNPFFGG